MIKTVKLIIVISLATVVGISVFMESAEARRRRSNGYSRTGREQEFVTLQFSLVDTTSDGNPIEEKKETLKNPYEALFVGAIEDYQAIDTNVCRGGQGEAGKLRIEDSEVALDSSGNPIFQVPFPGSCTALDIFEVGNLHAELIESDPDFGNRQTIEYSIIIPGITEPVQSFTLDFLDPPDESLGVFPALPFPDDFNPIQAINDLAYILENNLLAFTESPDLAFPESPGFLTVLVTDRTEEEIPDSTTVPEPSTPVSLLALAFLGTMPLLRRKIKLNRTASTVK